MSKTNLVAVLQKLIKEGPESAQDDLHQYFLETCVDINDNLNEDDFNSHAASMSSLRHPEEQPEETRAGLLEFTCTKQDLGAVKEVVSAYTTDVEIVNGEAPGTVDVYAKLENFAECEALESDIKHISGVTDIVSSVRECDEFDEDSADDAANDAAVDSAIDSEEDTTDDDAVGDLGDIDGDEDGDIDSLGDAGEVDLEDKVEDLETQLADLQAQFMALTGQGPLDSETVEIDPEDDSDTLVTTDDGEESPIDGSEEEEEETTEEGLTFEDEDFADLEEAYQLEKVQDPNLSGGKEIGANGQKISVNDKSPTLQKKVGDRIGGEPVEVISDDHSGYDREPSPSVKDITIAKNQQKKATQELKSVSKDGDKSALINKNDGFGTENTKSPVIPTKSLQK